MIPNEPDILSPTFHEDPNSVLEVMREECPVVYHEATQARFISRYGDVDLVDQFTIRFPINVIVGMLELDKSDHERFQKGSNSNKRSSRSVAASY